MKQLSLIPKVITEHGGSLNHRKRKSWKPLSTTKSVHLVLKCKKEINLYENRSFIEETIRRQAELSGVKLYGLSIQKDHIHHSLFFSHRKQYNAFIRSVTGLLGRKYGKGIWKYRPYTKIVEWGRQLKSLKIYIMQNELEVRGVIPYTSRK